MRDAGEVLAAAGLEAAFEGAGDFGRALPEQVVPAGIEQVFDGDAEDGDAAGKIDEDRIGARRFSGTPGLCVIRVSRLSGSPLPP